MRKEYDFSQSAKPRRAQIQELRRRVAGVDDVTRYLLVSHVGPRFALYYNVSDDVYAMNDPRGATLFKRHKAALAVRALLGKSLHVLRCKSKRVSGVRVPILRSAVGTGRRVRRNRRGRGAEPRAAHRGARPRVLRR